MKDSGKTVRESGLSSGWKHCGAGIIFVLALIFVLNKPEVIAEKQIRSFW